MVVPVTGGGAARNEATIPAPLLRPLQLGATSRDEMAQSLHKLAGFDWRAPAFTTVRGRQNHRAVEIAAQLTTSVLHLLVDSPSVKMLGRGEWKTRRTLRIRVEGIANTTGVLQC